MGKVIDRKTLKSSTNTQYGSDKSARGGFLGGMGIGNVGDRAPKPKLKFDERAEEKKKVDEKFAKREEKSTITRA